jgi:hypothetical protein
VYEHGITWLDAHTTECFRRLEVGRADELVRLQPLDPASRGDVEEDAAREDSELHRLDAVGHQTFSGHDLVLATVVVAGAVEEHMTERIEMRLEPVDVHVQTLENGVRQGRLQMKHMRNRTRVQRTLHLVQVPPE